MDSTAPRSGPNRWLALAVLLIGFFMILIDTTIVNVSIPTIIKDLGVSLTDIEWIISGYALSFAALLITFGRLGDLYGRRKLFMLGLFVFSVASLMSGEAHSSHTLILARLLQGVGGAMISPATLSIISSTFLGRERAAAFGAFGATSGIAVAVGPILGGWLTTYYSWRWIFRVNIPIGIIGMILAYFLVTESKSERGEKLDLAGMLTSSLGFFFLVFGLIEGQNYGWLKPAKEFVLGSFHWGTDRPLSIIAISFILAAVFLGTFLAIQAVKTKNNTNPAVDVTFFKSAAFRYGLVAIAVISLGEFSSLFTLPIFLQSIHGFTPLQSGYATLPLALAAFIAAPLSALVVNKIGSKWVITAGIMLEFLGIFLLGHLHVDTQYHSLVLPLIFLGAGIGLAISQNTQVILSDIDPRRSGSASGVLNTVRQVGSSLGIAVIGAVLAHQATIAIPREVEAIDLPALPAAVKQHIGDTVAAAGVSYASQGDGQTLSIPEPAQVAAIPAAHAQFLTQQAAAGTAIKEAVDTGLTESINAAIKVGSIFVLLGALLSLLIPNVKPKQGDEAAPAGH
jgi:EmrB/QacA subfamily drug resistance transporter